METFLKESFHTFKELPKKKFENSRYVYAEATNRFCAANLRDATAKDLLTEVRVDRDQLSPTNRNL